MSGIAPLDKPRRGALRNTLLTPDLPNIDGALFKVPDTERLHPTTPSTHSPRILLLYGSLRPRSFSRLLVEEAARLLHAMGAETRIFNPAACPCPTTRPIHIPRSWNCASSRNGPKAWCGAHPSATAP